MASEKELTTEEELQIMKEGFRFAKLYRHNWLDGVNRCPYGPAPPHMGRLRAEAWYSGWWFYFYVIKPWVDVCSL